jgi:hypothetical protein
MPTSRSIVWPNSVFGTKSLLRSQSHKTNPLMSPILAGGRQGVKPWLRRAPAAAAAWSGHRSRRRSSLSLQNRAHPLLNFRGDLV